MKRSTSHKLICFLAFIFATSASCASPPKASGEDINVEDIPFER